MARIKKDEICSFPNLISCFRIFLAFLFLACYQTDMEHKTAFLAGILILSGISDVLDGMIARKYGMVTELGKILDPFADKITQLAMLLCLLGRYPRSGVLLVIFFVKECLVGTAGYAAVRIQGRNEGAKWYGKLSTVIFYITIVSLILFADMDRKWVNILLGVCALGLLMALACYLRLFYGIFKFENKRDI